MIWQWIGSIVFAALAAISLVINGWAFHPLVLLVSGLMLGAAVLLFPPLWRGRPFAAWRIVVALLLAAAGFAAPVETHAVKFELVRPARH